MTSRMLHRLHGIMKMLLRPRHKIRHIRHSHFLWKYAHPIQSCTTHGQRLGNLFGKVESWYCDGTLPLWVVGLFVDSHVAYHRTTGHFMLRWQREGVQKVTSSVFPERIGFVRFSTIDRESQVQSSWCLKYRVIVSHAHKKSKLIDWLIFVYSDNWHNATESENLK